MHSVRPIDGGSVRETSTASSYGKMFTKGRNFTTNSNFTPETTLHSAAAGWTARTLASYRGRPEYPQATGDGRP